MRIGRQLEAIAMVFSDHRTKKHSKKASELRKTYLI